MIDGITSLAFYAKANFSVVFLSKIQQKLLCFFFFSIKMADIDLDQSEVVDLVEQLVHEKQQGFRHDESKQYFSVMLLTFPSFQMGRD